MSTPLQRKSEPTHPLMRLSDSARSRIACVVEPELFFPELDTNSSEVERAKALCAGCPVREQCRDYAVQAKESGIWGGTSGNQRKQLRRANRAAELREVA